MADGAIINLTRGIHRRIYSGAIYGKRVNKVSMGAEAWFWRLHMIADDFGNVVADPDLCLAAAAPRRKLKVHQIQRWMKELEDNKLIESYDHAGDRFAHIMGFLTIQPAGRNGKRIRRQPAWPGESTEKSYAEALREQQDDAATASSDTSPDESGCSRGNPGAAGGIRGDSRGSTKPRTTTRPKPRTEDDDDNEAEPEAQDVHVDGGLGSSSLKARAPSSDSDSTRRKKAYQSWLLATEKLFAPRGVRDQYRADQTSARRLFEDYVWPEHVNGEGDSRLKEALDMITQTSGAEKRMALLTTWVKKHFANT